MSGRVVVLRGDAAHLPLPDASIDAVVCDPPYALTELPVTKVVEALAAWLGGDRAYIPKTGAGGFMGREWDRFVPPPAAWDECLRVLKPGGHLLAFAAPRTADLMGMSIRLAGFEIRDGIDWIFGQGMPKSLDVSKAIDKAAPRQGMFAGFAAHLRECREVAGLTRRDIARHFPSKTGGLTGCAWNWENGVNVPTVEQWRILAPILGLSDEWLPLIERIEAEREVVGTKLGKPGYADTDTTGRMLPTVAHGGGAGYLDITAPATEDAARWTGWGTGLKPAQEPIVVARKPMAGTVAANVLKHGTGALNVAACQVGAEPRVNNAGGASSLQRVSRVEQGYRPTVTESRNEASEVAGRWPPNVVFTHAPGCVPAGTRKVRGCGGPKKTDNGDSSMFGLGQPGHVYGEHGLETVESTEGCVPGCPIAELDAQSGVSKSSGGDGRGYGPGRKGIYGDFGQQKTLQANAGGLGDTGGASRYFPVFRYEAKADSASRPRLPDGTVWPTVKPVPLIRWLLRLVTPPGGTILDPFCGTGPTGEAAIIEGFNAILLDKDPQAIALTRVRLAKPIQPLMFGLDPDPGERPRALGVPKPPPVPEDQGSLFDIDTKGNVA